MCIQRPGKGRDGQEEDMEVCHHQMLEQRVCRCSPAPGNANDGGLSDRQTPPHCWHIQYVMDPMALPHEIRCVHVTKVTCNESCPPPPFQFPFLFEDLAIAPPTLCFWHFTAKPHIMSNARKCQNHRGLCNLSSALFCERICS